MLVDLGASAFVGDECDAGSVGGEDGFGVGAGGFSQADGFANVGEVQGVDLEFASLRGEGCDDFLLVGGHCGGGVVSAKICQQPPFAGGQGLPVDAGFGDGLAGVFGVVDGLHCDIQEGVAVGGEAGGDERGGAGKGGHWVVAVVVGDAEFVDEVSGCGGGVGSAKDIGDFGVEDAGVFGDFFVYPVCHLVGDGAGGFQAGGLSGLDVSDFFLGDGVGEGEGGGEAGAVAGDLDGAGEEVFGAGFSGLGEGFGAGGGEVSRGEGAAAVEVVGDDLGEGLAGEVGLAGEGFDGDLGGAPLSAGDVQVQRGRRGRRQQQGKRKKQAEGESHDGGIIALKMGIVPFSATVPLEPVGG